MFLTDETFCPYGKAICFDNLFETTLLQIIEIVVEMKCTIRSILCYISNC